LASRSVNIASFGVGEDSPIAQREDNAFSRFVDRTKLSKLSINLFLEITASYLVAVATNAPEGIDTQTKEVVVQQRKPVVQPDAIRACVGFGKQAQRLGAQLRISLPISDSDIDQNVDRHSSVLAS
jgi:hypothetical protein